MGSILNVWLFFVSVGDPDGPGKVTEAGRDELCDVGEFGFTAKTLFEFFLFLGGSFFVGLGGVYSVTCFRCKREVILVAVTCDVLSSTEGWCPSLFFIVECVCVDIRCEPGGVFFV